MRYFAELSFDGGNYHGWQIQNNAVTVQEKIDQAISVLSGETICTVGCGRTDTGVHAKQFYIHFDLNRQLDEPNHFCYKLNRLLPEDISIKRILIVEPDQHARFHATSRLYRYYIHTKKNPFLRNHSYLLQKTPDIQLMNEGAKVILSHTDFASFCKVGSDQKTTLCSIKKCEWEQRGDQLIFTFAADRFLRNMVRAAVGTLLDLGKGRISVSEFEEILNRKDRNLAGTSAPANGLFLEEIEYPFL